MSDKIHLTIVTPEKPILDNAVTYVALPAIGGEMGILKGHAPMVVQLKEGILRYKTGDEEGTFAVMGGFAEILDDDVSVFAESASLAEDINLELERQELQKAKHILASKDKAMDIEDAHLAVKKAIIRIKLASYKTSIRKNRPN